MAVSVGVKTDLNNVLKHVHGPRMVKTFNDKYLWYNKLKKRRRVQFSGRDFLFSVHTKPASNGGFYTGSGDLPDASEETVQEASVAVKQIAARIALDGLSHESGKTNKDGFIRLLTFKTTRAAKNAANEMAQQIWSFSDQSHLNGIKAVVASYHAGSKTITCKDPLGYVSGTDVPNVGAARYFRAGQKIAWGAVGNGGGTLCHTSLTSGSTGTITEVNYANGTITLDAATHPPLGDDLICLGWSDSNWSYQKTNGAAALGISGFGTILDPLKGNLVGGGPNSTFQGIAVTPDDPTQWDSLRVTSGGAFDQQELHEAIQKLEQVGEGEPNFMVSDVTLLREYIADVGADVRLQPQALKGGYKMVEFASGRNLEWVFDKYCPYGSVFIGDINAAFWLMQRDFGWDTTDGKVLKYVADKDAFSAYFKGYMALGFEALNSFAVVKNINISGNAL